MRRLGFTLIELIVVIVITAVLGVVSASFLSKGVTFYVEASAIQKINSDIDFVSTKLRRMFENSIPNSLEVSSDETRVTFVPALGVFSYFYVAKNAEGGVDTSNKVLYVVKSPFFELAKNTIVAFANSDGEISYGTIKSIKETSDSANGYRYRVTLSDSSDFAPFTGSNRMFIADSTNRYVTLCYSSTENQIKIYHHNSKNKSTECASKGVVLADNIASATFSRDTGSYNASGELRVNYAFNYSKMNITRHISQRIGVANAP